MFIRTKYLAPTNHRGGRVKASSATGKSVTLAWDHALNIEDNHRAAAEALASALNLDGRWFGAQDENGGYVFVGNWGATFEVVQA